MSDSTLPPVIPAEGWNVLHLYYRVDHGAWSLLSNEEQIAAKTRLSELVQEIRATENCQLLTFAMVSAKADIGFMLLAADLHTANAFEKLFFLLLGPPLRSTLFPYTTLFR